ncbi:4'-phosphopantetheinyl transferase family protein [Streptomyces sp. NPDC002851]
MSAGYADEQERATVQIWFCPNDGLDEHTSALLARHWLDAHEHEIAGKFLFERDRRQYLVAHALVRRVLSLETGVPEAEATIWRSSRGRPFLQEPSRGPGRVPADGLDFNLSHAHGYNAVAVGLGRRVGVDVERLDRAAEHGLDMIVESFATEERGQIAAIPPGSRRDRVTLRLWTLKEAYAKARGLGLALPFDSFAFELAEDGGVLAFRPPEGDTAERWLFAEVEPRPQVLMSLAVECGGSGTPPPRRLLLHDGFPWGRAAPREVPLPPRHRALPALTAA